MNYFHHLGHDFLFCSDYHQQLTHILGMLPSTGVFFSVGNNLFARLAVLNAGELRELFSLMAQLREFHYFTSFQGATIHFKIFDGVKGKVKITLSEEK